VSVCYLTDQPEIKMTITWNRALSDIEHGNVTGGDAPSAVLRGGEGGPSIEVSAAPVRVPWGARF
jgi:hypothetical protein